MIIDIKNNKYNKKEIKLFANKVYFICGIVFISIIGYNLFIYYYLVSSIKDNSLIMKLNSFDIIIGILIGSFLATFLIKLYEDIKNKSKKVELCKNHAKIFLADIQRFERVFKNKRFDLMKISSVTVMKNWLNSFNYISFELNEEEVMQLVNYYSQIDKLVQYEKRLNYHLEAMQYSALKDYSHMKEYKELVALFSFEVNSLFKQDVSLLIKKLKDILN